MRIALAQYNPTVGDVDANARTMAAWIDRAKADGADLVVFGELSVLGYPPRDLLRKQGLVEASVAAVDRLAGHCRDIAALVGFVRPARGDTGRALENCAALLADGKVQRVHVKRLLPTYDVFDETRYFRPGPEPECFEVAGRRVGLSVCEDLWDAESLGRDLYGADPAGDLARRGAEVIINLAASPYEMGKAPHREALFARQAERSGAAIIFVNQVGGNDELIFDGASGVYTPEGKVLARAKSFSEDLLVVELDSSEPTRQEALGGEMQRLGEALKLGLGDYVRKCGFSSVVLGLSGGIDSSVVAVLAADALGPENVHVLAMPSRYSSEHSLADARGLAENVGVAYSEVPIEAMHSSFEQTARDLLEQGQWEITSENIQARLRGNLVMAWSNAFGHLPLATGNKSELSVGYCTLYGDMCGGLAPIGDVLKTQVYCLAKHLNAEAGFDRIPIGVLTKPPSAELKPDQTDQDKLPPYEVLDAILRLYVEEDRTAGEILAQGFPADVVTRVLRLVDLAEYKRQQAARVLKVSARAYGMGRRMPIAQRFVETPPERGR